MNSVSIRFGSSVGIPQIPVINLLISSPGIILPGDNYSQKSTNRIPEIPVGVRNSDRNRWGSVKTSAMVLCAKGTLLQVTTDKFKYKVK